jgi:hypothetical protein
MTLAGWGLLLGAGVGLGLVAEVDSGVEHGAVARFHYLRPDPGVRVVN